MKGYWNRPDATAAVMDRDGWFRTGDLARVDADGYFFIVERSKNMIVRDGYNVYPVRSKRSSTSIPPSVRPPSSVCPTTCSGRGGRRDRLG